ncbi:MAG: LysR substrate-binding domain-containing protein [Steroidobacteraceae bacterium]
MNLRDLQYFVALGETLHFGAAAERCHVSQPTLSAQLRKLEEYLGVTLFERRPRHVMLTAAGEELLPRARQIVIDAEQLRDAARRRRDPLEGNLRLGLIPTIAPYLLPRIATPLRKSLPKLAIKVIEQKTDALLEALHQGQIDMAVLALPVSGTGLVSRSLYAESFLVALPRRHPLAVRRRLRMRDLQGENLLLLDEGHCLRDQALELCRSVGVDEASDLRATSLETLRQMVAAGLGVTLMPRLACEGVLAGAKGLVYRPFAPPAPQRSIGAMWIRSSSRVVAIDALCELVSGAAQ